MAEIILTPHASPSVPPDSSRHPPTTPTPIIAAPKAQQPNRYSLDIGANPKLTLFRSFRSVITRAACSFANQSEAGGASTISVPHTIKVIQILYRIPIGFRNRGERRTTITRTYPTRLPSLIRGGHPDIGSRREKPPFSFPLEGSIMPAATNKITASDSLPIYWATPACRSLTSSP